MTHTPGPWEIRRVGIAKDLPVVTSAEHDVCEMRYNTNGRLRLENNARLIAAAPDLLAALKNLRDWIEEQKIMELVGFDDEQGLDDVMTFTRIALEKAEA